MRPSRCLELATRPLALPMRLMRRVVQAIRPGGDQAIAEPDAIVYQFARMLRGARAPSEVRAALVYLTHRLSGARRVELELDELPGRGPQLAACWPRADAEAPDDRPPRPAAARISSPPLCLPLQFEGKMRGRLRLIPRPGHRWSERAVRRLETLCVLAAAAELRSARLDDESATRDPVTGAHNPAYLGAFLTHALARARRRIEPVTLLAIELDDLHALRARLGDELTATALARAARAMMGTLRGSDVIARLEKDRLAAVLIGCDATDALRLADSVRHAIGEAEMASGLEPPPTVCVGTATYPDHALEAGPLLAAAIEALARARAQGPNHTAAAVRLKPNPAPSFVLHHVG